MVGLVLYKIFDTLRVTWQEAMVLVYLVQFVYASPSRQTAKTKIYKHTALIKLCVTYFKGNQGL